MPSSEWPMLGVDDVRKQTSDGLATGPFGSSVSAKFFQGSGVPLIRGSNLSEAVGERLVENDFVFVSEEKAAEFPRAVARPGDLIFTCWGTIGQVGLIDGRARYSRYLVSNKQMKLSPDPEKADCLFLYYLFKSPAMKAAISGVSIGSSVPGFNLGQLRGLRFPLPPLLEQRAIATAIGSLDDKIEQNRRTGRVLEGLARATFKAWFVDFEPVKAKSAGAAGFPGMQGAAFASLPDRLTDSMVGLVPQGWAVRPLVEAFDINPPRRLSKGQDAPYLDMKNMPTDGHAPDAWERRPHGSGMRFINGDTLVARITPCLENGKTAFVDFLNDGEVAWGSTEYIVLRPKSPLPEVYAYCLARTSEFRDFAIQNMTGTSGRQRVAAAALDHYHIPIPDAVTAATFGEVARPLFECIRAGKAESSRLAALRDYLLPRLLSGEVSVKSTGAG